MTNLSPASTKTTKYLLLAQTLRSQIHSGALSPGDRLPSFALLKENYQATQGTAEKALDLLERDGLISRQPGRGIFVADKNLATPKLRRKKTRAKNGIIGIIGAGFSFDTNASYWANLLRGLRAAASEAGMHLLLLDPESNQGWEKADGVVVCDWTAHEIMGRVASEQPCVSLLTEVLGRASIVPDDRQGILEATRHLLNLGHRKISYLHGGYGTIPRRVAGYCEALCEFGIVPDGGWTRVLSGEYFDSNDFEERGCEHMRDWIQNGWLETGCTAILAHNDATARGVIEALREAGLEVPKDISVIGFDGVEKTAKDSLPLTTVALPLEAIGRRGMERLLDQIETDKSDAAQELIAPQLVVGLSSARVSSHDENQTLKPNKKS